MYPTTRFFENKTKTIQEEIKHLQNTSFLVFPDFNRTTVHTSLLVQRSATAYLTFRLECRTFGRHIDLSIENYGKLSHLICSHKIGTAPSKRTLSFCFGNLTTGLMNRMPTFKIGDAKVWQFQFDRVKNRILPQLCDQKRFVYTLAFTGADSHVLSLHDFQTPYRLTLISSLTDPALLYRLVLPISA
ncbi:hypothetical protein CSKR_106596, partial [Clonorchis sinensis]